MSKLNENVGILLSSDVVPKPVPERRLRNQRLPPWATEYDVSGCRDDVEVLHQRLSHAGLDVAALLGVPIVSTGVPVQDSLNWCQALDYDALITPKATANPKQKMASVEIDRFTTLSESPSLSESAIMDVVGAHDTDDQAVGGSDSAQQLAFEHGSRYGMSSDVRTDIGQDYRTTKEETEYSGMTDSFSRQDCGNEKLRQSKKRDFDVYLLQGPMDAEALRQIRAPYSPIGVDLSDWTWGTFRRLEKHITKPL